MKEAKAEVAVVEKGITRKTMQMERVNLTRQVVMTNKPSHTVVISESITRTRALAVVTVSEVEVVAVAVAEAVDVVIVTRTTRMEMPDPPAEAAAVVTARMVSTPALLETVKMAIREVAVVVAEAGVTTTTMALVRTVAMASKGEVAVVTVETARGIISKRAKLEVKTVNSAKKRAAATTTRNAPICLTKIKARGQVLKPTRRSKQMTPSLRNRFRL